MTQQAIIIDGLTKRYGDKIAVDDLNLKIEAGTVFGFLGRNGAGKTTTIKILLNLLSPTSGRTEILGMDPQKDGVRVKEKVGYVGDVPALYGWMRAAELISFTSSFYQSWDDALVADLLGRFGLDLQQRVKTFSRGQTAQLALALALGPHPEVLILDEPATGLDVMVRRDFLESIIHVIQDEGRTVFLSSHLVHEVERVADEVAIIEEGRLVARGSVDVIKDRVKRVLVRSTDGAADYSAIGGVRDVQGDGDGPRMLTVMDYGPAQEAAIKAQGGEIVEVIGASLEESFIEHVRPGVGRVAS